VIESFWLISAALALAGVAVLFSVISLYKLKANKALLHQALTQNQTHMLQLESLCSEAQLRVEENHAALMTLHQSVNPLHARLDALEAQLREQEPQDPQIKLYQKAAAMAKSNATAEEIATACELPFAEAQMLVNLYTPKA